MRGVRITTSKLNDEGMLGRSEQGAVGWIRRAAMNMLTSCKKQPVASVGVLTIIPS